MPRMIISVSASAPQTSVISSRKRGIGHGRSLRKSRARGHCVWTRSPGLNFCVAMAALSPAQNCTVLNCKRGLEERYTCKWSFHLDFANRVTLRCGGR